MPGQAKRRAAKEAAERRARALAELEARRLAEQELADRDKHGQDRRATLPRVAARAAFRARRILAPFLLLAVLATAAWGGAVAELPALVPAVLWLIAAAGLWVQRLRDQLRRDAERRYAAVCVTAGAVWLGWAGLSGPGTVDSILVVGWAVLSVPWWAHHWPRPRIEPPVVEADLDTIPERWARNVGATDRKLPGAVLHSPTLTEHGDAYVIQAVPGKAGQQKSEILGGLPAISQGLKTPMERVVVDEHPDYPEDPSVFRLQIIRRSPIRQTVYFDRPRWEDGRILLGPHADGIGDAVWRLYSDNSMWGGFLLGGTGGGKTGLLNLIGLTARAMSPTMPTTLLYLDGQDGASSPTLWEHSTWRGGPAEADALLCGLERGMAIRQKWNRIHRLSGFTPGVSPDGVTPGLPGVLTIVDEQHRIFDATNGLRWANVAREGRKVGMAVVGADQFSDLETFGGKDALRSSLLAGNGLALRTLSRMASSLVPGVALDPTTFPELPGYGYKIAAANSGERTAPFRARFLPDAKDAERIPDLPVPTVEEWFARTTDAELDEMTARAFGPVFLDRHRLAEESTRAAWDEIEGRTPTAPEPEQVVVTKPGRTATADVILALLADRGPTSRADLDTEVHRLHGTGPDAVQKALQGLLERGAVERLKRGVYALTGSGQAAA